MIARRRHDEVKISIDLLAVPLSDHCLESSGGLLEGYARVCSVAAELAKTKS
jgi:hypothetical protein